MRLLLWAFKALIFFTLFAFALNNQHTITVHWFFGVTWSAPLVLVLLAVFALGAALGVLAMVPSWWRGWRAVRREVKGEKVRQQQEAAAVARATESSSNPTESAILNHPPRDGL